MLWVGVFWRRIRHRVALHCWTPPPKIVHGHVACRAQGVGHARGAGKGNPDRNSILSYVLLSYPQWIAPRAPCRPWHAGSRTLRRFTLDHRRRLGKQGMTRQGLREASVIVLTHLDGPCRGTGGGGRSAGVTSRNMAVVRITLHTSRSVSN